MNDIQTHLIPTKGELLDKLAIYLGFRNVKDFIEEVGIKRKRVNKIYNSVMGKEDMENVKTDISDINFQTSVQQNGTGFIFKKEKDYSEKRNLIISRLIHLIILEDI